jgi:hypothetical protein
MTEPVNDTDRITDWPIHHLTDDKFIEYEQSLRTALKWQQDEAEATAKAFLYLSQAAQGIVPHD